MRLFVCAAALSAAAIAAPAHADLYRYTGQVTASGTVGSQSFTNVPVTITLIGDTSNYEFNNGTLFRLRDVSNAATIDIAGLGIATVTSNDFMVFSSTFFGTAGFGRSGGNPLVRSQNNLIFTNLASPLGPIATTPVIVPNSARVGTTLGELNFSSVSGSFVFTATLVPTPGAAAMLAMGGLLAMRRRR